MQLEVWQKSDNQQDIQLLSPTGSGKTLAFLLPMLRNLHHDATGVQALIISPTRELALQLESVFKRLTNQFKVLCCYGGHATQSEANSFIESPAVVIGTPGRLAYHIDAKNFEPLDVTTIVLDEFDKSLELGFYEELGFILGRAKSVRQFFMASATHLSSLPDFIPVKNPLVINYLEEDSLVPNYQVKKLVGHDKTSLLLTVLDLAKGDKTIVFANTREQVIHLSQALASTGLRLQVYHGGLEQTEREKALIRFRNGSAHVLLTTDLGARGLDIEGVTCILHYELPQRQSAFVHRSGRTARMQNGGVVYVFDNDKNGIDYFDPNWDEADLTITCDKKPLKPLETLYFSLGKKDKLGKVDVVGFLTKIGGMAVSDIGLITMMDRAVYVAVPAQMASVLVNRLNQQKIKGKKVKIAIAN